jgi:hypothetical protein
LARKSSSEYLSFCRPNDRFTYEDDGMLP